MKILAGLLIGIVVVLLVASVWGGLALVVLNAVGVIHISWVLAFAPLLLAAVLYILIITGIVAST